MVLVKPFRENFFFENVENYHIQNREDIRFIRKRVEQILAPREKKYHRPLQQLQYLV